MATALPAPTEAKGSGFGITSFVFAALTVIAPVVIAVFFGVKAADSANDPAHHHPLESLGFLLAGGVLAVMAAGASGLVGSVAGAIALARGERGIWRAVIGLIVNVPILLFVAYLFVTARANSGS